MSAIGILYVIYAIVLLAGGVMGFLKASSLPSLIAGIVAAALMFVAFGMLGQGHTGLILGAVVSAVMDAFFMLRYVKTKKAMPAIPISVLSVLVLVFSIIKLV